MPNKAKLNFFQKTIVRRAEEPLERFHADNNTFNLEETSITGKYFWKEIPREFEYCNTSEELGVKVETLVQFFSKDGFKFAELCMPQGFGVLYMRLLQSKDFMNNYYNSDYDDEALTLSNTPTKLMMERSVNKVEIYCRPFLKNQSKVLDIGCGFGDQLAHFRDKGHITKGIEPGKERALFGINNYGLDILNEQLEALESKKVSLGEKFDLIYLNQVFEHLYNPVSLLKFLKSHLADDGIIFIAVPNFNFEGILVKMLSTIHTHSFTSTGLVSLASTLGLKLEKNFSDEFYNIMIFKKGNIIFSPSGSDEIKSKLFETFALSEKLKSGDKIITSTNTLGLWEATFKFTSERSTLDLPIKIKTDFLYPQLLFK
jgi:2-polyprenyl-3-methyl-5-hydroxy-6-metoxy-1,4-benzoquinol methylase